MIHFGSHYVVTMCEDESSVISRRSITVRSGIGDIMKELI